MSRFCYLILFAFLFTSPSYAQEEASVEDKLKYLKLSVITPSISYGFEKKLSDKGVLEVEGGFWGIYRYDTYGPLYFDDYPYQANLISHTFKVSPYINVGYKNYYNIKKRVNQGKNIDGNAANYFGVSLLGNLDGFVFQKLRLKSEGIKSGTDRNREFSSNFGLYVVPKWGFQRNIKETKYQYFTEVCPHILADVENMEIDIQLQIGIKLKL